jgi:hypothetical protein
MPRPRPAPARLVGPGDPEHAAWLDYHRELLAIRARDIMPLLPRMGGGAGRSQMLGDAAPSVEWMCTDGARLTLLANLGESSVRMDARPGGRLLHATAEEAEMTLAGWSVRWHLEEGGEPS